MHNYANISQRVETKLSTHSQFQLRALRYRLSLTRSQFAKLIKMNVNRLKLIENSNNETYMLRLHELVSLSAIFDVSIEDLITNNISDDKIMKVRAEADDR